MKCAARVCCVFLMVGLLHAQEASKHPTGVLTGRVVDDDGRPMRGIEVAALSMTYSNGKRQLLPHGNPALTNDRGEFRLFWLESGDYFIVISPEPIGNLGILLRAGQAPIGYLPTDPDSTFVTTYFPGTWDFRKAEAISVGPGETDVHAVEVAALPSRTVRMRIVNPKLVEGLYVPFAAFEKLKESGLPRLSARTPRRMGNGEYEIRTGLLPGEYQLSIQVQTPDGSYAGKTPITIDGSTLDTIAIDVERTLSIQGRVSSDERSTLRVVAIPNDASGSGFPILSEVRPDGRFILEDIIPGTYSFSVDGLGSAAYIDSVQLGDQELPADDVEFSADDESKTLNLTVKQDGGNITGVVIDQTRTAQTAAPVLLIPDDPSQQTRPYQLVYSNPQGEFEFRGVPPGKYVLVALPQTESTQKFDEDSLKQIESLGTEINVAAKSRISVGVLPLAKR